MASSPTEGQDLFAGRYELRKSLGQGSAGKVYLAFDTVLRESVALKTLNEALTPDDVQVKRFLREVAVTRKVTHPNVVRTYDVGNVESTIFFTMEHVSGMTLKERIAETPLDLEQGLAVIYEICKGLHAIHESDIVHRDLKLTNIIVANDGFIKISDFGVARPGVSDLTTNEDLVGTATHMAPEVWRSGTITKQTDLYSLGVLFYEIFAGILPFSGESPMELMYHHIHSNPPSLSVINPSVPKWIDSLAKRLLQKSANQRPESVEEVMYLIEKRGEVDSKPSQLTAASDATKSLEFSVDPAILNKGINSTLRPKIKLDFIEKKVRKNLHFPVLAPFKATFTATLAVAPLIASPFIFSVSNSFLPRLDLSGAAFANHVLWHLAILSAITAWPISLLNFSRRGLACGAITFATLFISFCVASLGPLYFKLSNLLNAVPTSEVFGLNTDYLPKLLYSYRSIEPHLNQIAFLTVNFESKWYVLAGVTALLAILTLAATPSKNFIKIALLGLVFSAIGFSPLLLGETHALSTVLGVSSPELLLPVDHSLRLFLVWWVAFLVDKNLWKRRQPKDQGSS